ncbi:Hypothetical protein PHPALM_16527 [Phytophthora palmivora]|uniref:Uncharacterized protein n=1 Tax=Phytophthora palmivora TaxID=4796 RepID=A0A2P4XPL3_9STRA|nr:Hypothetical protein PHPALM_16527 [Phytophthora palmivora]
MLPRVSTATVALAVTILSTVLPDDVDARPMHADIVSKYHRYLEEKDTISTELDDWLSKYGPAGNKNGYIPVTESRSSDDALEDQRQRFYLTKEQIYEAREANPMAEFTTDGPFTLMTMDEFKQFLSNTHVSESEKTERPAVEKPKTLSEKQNDTPSTDESKHNESKNEDSKNHGDNESKNNDTKKKTSAPATEGPTVIAPVRQLRSSGKSQFAFNGGDYSNKGEQGFQSTSENYIQTPQQTYQANTATNNNGGNTNGGWTFRDVSTGDSVQVGVVSGGTGSNTGNWWGTNGLQEYAVDCIARVFQQPMDPVV